MMRSQSSTETELARAVTALNAEISRLNEVFTAEIARLTDVNAVYSAEIVRSNDVYINEITALKTEIARLAKLVSNSWPVEIARLCKLRFEGFGSAVWGQGARSYFALTYFIASKVSADLQPAEELYRKGEPVLQADGTSRPPSPFWRPTEAEPALAPAQRPAICVLSLSPIADDPRVRRQGEAFDRAGWTVIAVGLPGARSPEPGWRIMTSKDPHAWNPALRGTAIGRKQRPDRTQVSGSGNVSWIISHCCCSQTSALTVSALVESPLARRKSALVTFEQASVCRNRGPDRSI